MVEGANGWLRLTWRQVLVVAVVAASTAACGSDGGTPTDAPSTQSASATAESPVPAETRAAAEPTNVSFEDASTAYDACLVVGGSTSSAIPAGQSLEDLAELGDASAATLAELSLDEVFIRAHATCWPPFAAAIAAGATPPPAADPSPAADPEAAAMMHAAVECLNERGWDFLEPGVETGPLAMAPRQADFAWDDAALKDQRECQELAGMMG